MSLVCWKAREFGALAIVLCISLVFTLFSGCSDGLLLLATLVIKIRVDINELTLQTLGLHKPVVIAFFGVQLACGQLRSNSCLQLLGNLVSKITVDLLDQKYLFLYCISRLKGWFYSMKICQSSIKQSTIKGGEKGTGWKHSCPSKKNKRPVGADCNGNMNKSSTESPPVTMSI